MEDRLRLKSFEVEERLTELNHILSDQWSFTMENFPTADLCTDCIDFDVLIVVLCYSSTPYFRIDYSNS